MKREDAVTICNNLLTGSGQLGRYFKTFTVCGSIRRKRPEVNDIDIVAIPIDESEYVFGEPTLAAHIGSIDPDGLRQSKELGKQAAGRFLNGDKIKRFMFHEMMIDLYLATEDNYECLVLIRTGSTEHNVRLTTLAKYKNMKLKAGGEGLVDRDNESIRYETTEEGILKRLLGKYVEPENRGII